MHENYVAIDSDPSNTENVICENYGIKILAVSRFARHTFFLFTREPRAMTRAPESPSNEIHASSPLTSSRNRYRPNRIVPRNIRATFLFLVDRDTGRNPTRQIAVGDIDIDSISAYCIHTYTYVYTYMYVCPRNPSEKMSLEIAASSVDLKMKVPFNQNEGDN